MTDERNMGETLDKLLSCIGGLEKRLSSMEKSAADYDKRNRADARKRARADAEAAKGKDAPAPPMLNDPDDPDRGYGDPKQTAADDNTGTANMSEDDLPTKILRAKALRDELYALEGEVKRDMRVQGPLCEAESELMADAQARADSAYSALGKRCPGPMPGERLAQYHARILNPLKRYSQTWRDVKIENFAGKNLEKIERDIIVAAKTFADSAENCPSDGGMQAVIKTDDSGRRITEWRGRSSFINQFKGVAYRATIQDPRAIQLRELLQKNGM